MQRSDRSNHLGHARVPTGTTKVTLLIGRVAFCRAHYALVQLWCGAMERVFSVFIRQGYSESQASWITQLKFRNLVVFKSKQVVKQTFNSLVA